MEPPEDQGSRRAQPAERSAGPARLLLRFSLGAAELAGEGLARTLRLLAGAADGSAPPQGADTDGAAAKADGPALRHVAIGALDAAPGWLRQVVEHARLPGGASARVLARRGSRLLDRLPGGRRLRADYAELRARATLQLERWAAVGQIEESAARALARATLDGLFELGAARLADSPALRRVIEEQSQGLTSSAIAELRDRSARADRAVEAIARRLTGRPSRSGR